METHPSLDKANAYFDIQFGRTDSGRRVAVGPFITLSRESGTGGSALAEEIGRRLNRLQAVDKPVWTTFDRNLVTRMLEDHHLSTTLARFLPEDKVSDIDASVGEIVGLHPSIRTLVHQTNSLMRRLASMGNVILVGRGANLAATGTAHGLHLRLIAPSEQRAQTTARGLGIAVDQAYVFNRKTDHARRDYVRSFFDADIDDPSTYDLIVNLEHFTLDQTADLVVSVLRSRGEIEWSSPAPGGS